MRIAVRLAVVAVVPLLGALGFGLYIGRDAMGDEASARSLAAVSNLLTRAGSAVHEMQIERGYSATYIASQGQKFGPELIEQRKKVDEQASLARNALSSLDGSQLGNRANTILQRAVVDLDQNLATVSQIRPRVSARDVATPDVIKTYSAAIDTLIDLGQLAGTAGREDRVNDLSKTLVSVLEVKENAGLERAFGSAELARGALDLSSTIRLVDLASQQRLGLRTAGRLADPQLRQMFVDLDASPEGKLVENIRAQMLASLASGDLGKLTSEQWFAASSARINKLKAIQDAISVALGQATAKMAEGARFNLMVTICLIALVIAVSILGSILMSRSLVRAVRSVAQALAGIKEGTKDVVVPELARTDEIGDVARSVDAIRTLGRDSTLVVSALKGSSSLLMITDVSEHITFMSPALLDLLQKLEPTFRQGNPGFAVAAMFGQHIDCYRTNPNLKRQLLSDDGKLRHVRYEIASTVIQVEMSYIVAADGEKVGHTLLWNDITKELAAQKTVSAVVAAAARGDFSERVPTADADGFVREIAEGLNAISATVEDAIGDVGMALRAVAAGDLTHRSKTAYEGTIGALQADIANTVERLADTIARLQASTSEVSRTAAEIEAGADDLSRRTEDQASSLEQTAATTEELAASVKATAQASRRAVSLSEEAAEVARTGGGIVANAVGAMARIEQASHRISDIIGVIDEIAFQTNLLALNAAVEAARAGDAGRGFAVVASEVRALAQRSSAAAKDISALISSSNGEVTDGVKLVKSAGEVLAQIVEASHNVSTMVSEISTATGEQASGIEEMSQAVAHMDGMTQQNAAMAEESVASSQSLAAQTVELAALAARFKVNEERPSSNVAKLMPVRRVA